MEDLFFGRSDLVDFLSVCVFSGEEGVNLSILFYYRVVIDGKLIFIWGCFLVLSFLILYLIVFENRWFCFFFLYFRILVFWFLLVWLLLVFFFFMFGINLMF